jgi:hypothetical protein
MAEQKATNIVWHQGAVTRADREKVSSTNRLASAIGCSG